MCESFHPRCFQAPRLRHLCLSNSTMPSRSRERHPCRGLVDKVDEVSVPTYLLSFHKHTGFEASTAMSFFDAFISQPHNPKVLTPTRLIKFAILRIRGRVSTIDDQGFDNVHGTGLDLYLHDSEEWCMAWMAFDGINTQRGHAG